MDKINECVNRDVEATGARASDECPHFVAGERENFCLDFFAVETGALARRDAHWGLHGGCGGCGGV